MSTEVYGIHNDPMNKRNTPVFHYVFLTTGAALVLLPFIWLLMASLKTNDDLLMHPFGPPLKLAFENYARAWVTIQMPVLFKNSIFLCSVSVIILLLITSMAAYAISRSKLKINLFFYSYFLIGMMIPLNSAIIPLFFIYKNIGLNDTFAGVILAYVAFGIPMAIFLFTSSMKAIPVELEESAIIDGCGVWGIFYYIILPLSRTMFATVAIMSFMGLWNEFLFALVFLNGSEKKTVPLGILSLQGEFNTDFVTMYAGIIIAVIPTIIIYMLLRNKIVKGMTAGAIKG